jgi:hypothetical protein
LEAIYFIIHDHQNPYSLKESLFSLILLKELYEVIILAKKRLPEYYFTDKPRLRSKQVIPEEKQESSSNKIFLKTTIIFAYKFFRLQVHQGNPNDFRVEDGW